MTWTPRATVTDPWLPFSKAYVKCPDCHRSGQRVSNTADWKAWHLRWHAENGVDPPTTALPWAPPTASWTIMRIGPATPEYVNLAPGTDYHIVCDEPIPHRVKFTGGRHIKALGVEFNIPLPADTSPQPHTAFVKQCGFEFQSTETRTVFLEGCKVAGPGALDGIRAGAPQGDPSFSRTTFVLQNCHLFSDRFQTVTDVEDGLFHTDGFQCWSGLAGLSMFNTTIINRYQGGMFGGGNVMGDWGPTYFERVNFACPSTAETHRRLINFVPNARLVGPFTFKGDTVFYRYNETQFSWTVGGAFYSNVALGVDASGRRYGQPSQAVAANGVNDGAGGPGRIYIGLPPGGDYAPAGRTGMGYVSPGYV